MKNKSERVLQILKENPKKAFDARTLKHLFNNQYSDHLTDKAISKIVTRVISKTCLRSNTQASYGYLYTFSDSTVIQEEYERYLVSDNIPNRLQLLALIKHKPSEKLHCFQSGLENPSFLAILTGFLIGDGNLSRKSYKVRLYFFLEKDAWNMARDLEKKFGINGKIRFQHGCFRLEYCNKSLYKTLRNIGVPENNKVFRPFLVPAWILHGEEEIKRGFLQGIFGAEGSKPFRNHWRIQFVISKNDLYLENLLTFINQLKAMLNYFRIETSHSQLRTQKGREFHVRFYINGEENVRKFYEKIGFAYASEKQEALGLLAHTYKP